MPDIQKLMEQLAGTKNKKDTGSVLEKAAALSPALAALKGNKEAVANLTNAKTAEEVQAELAKNEEIARLFQTNPAAANQLTAQQNLPEYFQGLSINLAETPMTTEETDALLKAPPFNGQVLQVLNDGVSNKVRMITGGSIVLPSSASVYGQADTKATALARVRPLNSHGDLVVQIGNFAQPGAAINSVVVPAKFAASVTIVNPTTGVPVKLSELPVSGGLADDQVKLTKVLRGELGSLELADRFTDLGAYAKQHGQTESALLTNFAKTLSAYKLENALIGKGKAAEGQVNINQFPVLGELSGKSYMLNVGENDSKTLDSLEQGATGELGAAFKAKIEEMRKGAKFVFLPVKDTERIIAVPTFQVKTQIKITINQEGSTTPRVITIDPGTMLTKDRVASLQAMASGQVDSKSKYTIAPADLTKALLHTNSYVVVNKDPVNASQTWGMFHVPVDSGAHVIAVTSANAGIISNFTTAADPTAATTTSTAFPYDPYGTAASDRNLDPKALDHSIPKAAAKVPESEAEKLLAGFKHQAEAAAPREIAGEPLKKPVLAKGAKLPSEGWLAKLKSTFSNN